MKTISFKLTRRELEIIIEFLLAAHVEKRKEPLLRYVHHGLDDILHKMLLAKVLFKQDYRISLSVWSCLALLTYWEGNTIIYSGLGEALKSFFENAEKTNVINRITGIIDQKTI